MTTPEWEDTAAARLLYDDAAPRLRDEELQVVVVARRPGFLMVPLAFALAIALPALATAYLLAPFLSVPVGIGALGVAGFLVVSQLIARVVIWRSTAELAATLPAQLQVSFSLLAALFVAGFADALGQVEWPQVTAAIGYIPVPPVEGELHQLASAYIVAFAVLTGVSVVSVVMFRFLGFRRTVALEV